jgi:hypothetical protein
MTPEKGNHIAAMSRLSSLQAALRKVPVIPEGYMEAVEEAVAAWEKFQVSEWAREDAVEMLPYVLEEIGR